MDALDLLTGADGFPLMVSAFEGNKAETKTMLPVIFGSDNGEGGVSERVLAIARYVHLEGVVQHLNLAALARSFFGEDYRDKLLLTACIALPLIFLIRGVAAFDDLVRRMIPWAATRLDPVGGG